jgi:hypothetical protein
MPLREYDSLIPGNTEAEVGLFAPACKAMTLVSSHGFFFSENHRIYS